MAKSLFQAGLSAGRASGKYQASLYDISDRWGAIDYETKKAAMSLDELNEKVELAATGLEFASIVAGAYEDKKTLETEYLPELEKKRFQKEYTGDLSFEEFKAQKPSEYTQRFEAHEIERNIWDKLKGDKPMYQFGSGDDATQFTKARVTAAGKYAKGISDWDELGLDDSDYFGFQENMGDISTYEADYSDIGVSDYKESFPWSMLDEAQKNMFEKLKEENSSLNIYDWYRDDKNPIWD